MSAAHSSYQRKNCPQRSHIDVNAILLAASSPSAEETHQILQHIGLLTPWRRDEEDVCRYLREQLHGQYGLSIHKRIRSWYWLPGSI
jgi:hypothetical protein